MNSTNLAKLQVRKTKNYNFQYSFSAEELNVFDLPFVNILSCDFIDPIQMAINADLKEEFIDSIYNNVDML